MALGRRRQLSRQGAATNGALRRQIEHSRARIAFARSAAQLVQPRHFPSASAKSSWRERSTRPSRPTWTRSPNRQSTRRSAQAHREAPAGCGPCRICRPRAADARARRRQAEGGHEHGRDRSLQLQSCTIFAQLARPHLRPDATGRPDRRDRRWLDRRQLGDHPDVCGSQSRFAGPCEWDRPGPSGIDRQGAAAGALRLSGVGGCRRSPAAGVSGAQHGGPGAPPCCRAELLGGRRSQGRHRGDRPVRDRSGGTPDFRSARPARISVSRSVTQADETGLFADRVQYRGHSHGCVAGVRRISRRRCDGSRIPSPARRWRCAPAPA